MNEREAPRIVRKENCIAVCAGNQVLGNFAGPDCEQHAEMFLKALASAPAATQGEMDAEYWAELFRLREAVKGPSGYATWQDAAVDERVRRVKAERALAAPTQDTAPARTAFAEAFRKAGLTDEQMHRVWYHLPEPAQPAPQQGERHRFYGVTSDAALIEAQAKHIDRLYAKLPKGNLIRDALDELAATHPAQPAEQVNAAHAAQSKGGV